MSPSPPSPPSPPSVIQSIDVSPSPSPSPGIYEQSYVEIVVQQSIFLCISVLIFHYALDFDCSESRRASYAPASGESPSRECGDAACAPEMSVAKLHTDVLT